MSFIDRIPSHLEGLFVFKAPVHHDSRGNFTKVYSDALAERNIHFEIKEFYYSVSKKNVLRGMHFQSPPNAYHKIVHCIKGSVHDVALDIRKGSPTYGQSFGCALNDKDGSAIYLPPGFAHGFYALEDESIVSYLVSRSYDPKSDQGLRWNSFGYTSWPSNEPILSPRDYSNTLFTNYESPFVYA